VHQGAEGTSVDTSVDGGQIVKPTAANPSGINPSGIAVTADAR
jgi:hypothetical protein